MVRNYAGIQVTQWDYEGKSGWTGKPSAKLTARAESGRLYIPAFSRPGRTFLESSLHTFVVSSGMILMADDTTIRS